MDCGFGERLVGIADGEGVELVHHLDRGEHVLVVGATVVATLSEDDVDAETPPEEAVLRRTVEEVAVGKVRVGDGFGAEGSMAEGTGNHIADAGGAVVAEEVVEVVAVFGQIVGLEGDKEVVDFLG